MIKRVQKYKNPVEYQEKKSVFSKAAGCRAAVLLKINPLHIFSRYSDHRHRKTFP